MEKGRVRKMYENQYPSTGSNFHFLSSFTSKKKIYEEMNFHSPCPLIDVCVRNIFIRHIMYM